MRRGGAADIADARGQRREIERVAAVQGQIVDALFSDHSAGCGGISLQVSRGRAHFYRFAGSPGLQFKVDGMVFQGLDVNVVLAVRPESICCDLHTIGAGRQEGHLKAPAAVGSDNFGFIRAQVGDGDLGARNDRTGIVGNNAGQRAGRRLRKHRCAKQSTQKQQPGGFCFFHNPPDFLWNSTKRASPRGINARPSRLPSWSMSSSAALISLSGRRRNIEKFWKRCQEIFLHTKKQHESAGISGG